MTAVRFKLLNLAELLAAVIVALFVLGVVLPDAGPVPGLSHSALSVPGLVCILLTVVPLVLIAIGIRSRKTFRIVGWVWLVFVLVAAIAIPYIHI
jgi:hypothetical protein